MNVISVQCCVHSRRSTVNVRVNAKIYILHVCEFKQRIIRQKRVGFEVACKSTLMLLVATYN